MRKNFEPEDKEIIEKFKRLQGKWKTQEEFVQHAGLTSQGRLSLLINFKEFSPDYFKAVKKYVESEYESYLREEHAKFQTKENQLKEEATPEDKFPNTRFEFLSKSTRNLKQEIKQQAELKPQTSSTRPDTVSGVPPPAPFFSTELNLLQRFRENSFIKKPGRFLCFVDNNGWDFDEFRKFVYHNKITKAARQNIRQYQDAIRNFLAVSSEAQDRLTSIPPPPKQELEQLQSRILQQKLVGVDNVVQMKYTVDVFHNSDFDAVQFTEQYPLAIQNGLVRLIPNKPQMVGMSSHLSMKTDKSGLVGTIGCLLEAEGRHYGVTCAHCVVEDSGASYTVMRNNVQQKKMSGKMVAFYGGNKQYTFSPSKKVVFMKADEYSDLALINVAKLDSKALQLIVAANNYDDSEHGYHPEDYCYFFKVGAGTKVTRTNNFGFVPLHNVGNLIMRNQYSLDSIIEHTDSGSLVLGLTEDSVYAIGILHAKVGVIGLVQPFHLPTKFEISDSTLKLLATDLLAQQILRFLDPSYSSEEDEEEEEEHEEEELSVVDRLFLNIHHL